MAVAAIFDAGPLISVCKCAVGNTVVIDLLIPVVSITLPTAAYQEVVVAGARYPDAAMARQRVEAGSIRVETPQPHADLATVLALYNLGRGETEAIVLTAEKTAQGATVTLVVDDILAYMVCECMSYSATMYKESND